MNGLLRWYRNDSRSDLILGSGPACILLFFLAYHTPREAFSQLVLLWMSLFALYAWWLFPRNRDKKSSDRVTLILGLGIVLRLLVFPALPTLSDDYYRFLWDGQLLLQGVNPFTILPETLAADPARLVSLGLNQTWFESLNSPGYFTIYPPVLQGIFALGAGGGSIYAGVLIMKLFVLAAEILSLFLLRSLLHQLRLPSRYLAWYALNPLVIVELSGNLHFEALMICFSLAAWRFLLQGRQVMSALALGLAISSKLLPLIFLPGLIRRIGWLAAIRYGLVAGGLTLLLFLPLLSEDMIQGFRESLSLYINRFEFNAGLWYLIRWIGTLQTGWNPIREVGPWISLISGICILMYAALEARPTMSNWGRNMMLSLSIYLAFSLIVHPWYLVSLVAFATLSKRSYPLLWSMWGIWTYLAYQVSPVEESMWLVALEYITVLVWAIWENKVSTRTVVSL